MHHVKRSQDRTDITIMCGVSGFTWRDESLCRRMAATLSHRGPDEIGVWCDDAVSLGHTRLKVIDLTASGDQQMASDDGMVVLVYNGEIYNFQELRTEFESSGARFRGTSDTEVLLRAYEAWGTECFGRFNGMWAVAIHDRREGKVVLCRDRIGVKPLHYSVTEKGLIFASEIKAILEHGVSREIDTEAVDLLLSAQFVPSPWTLFKSVRKLEPRHLLIWDLASRRMEKRCYYPIPEYRPEDDLESLVEEGRRLIDDATRRRLVADVPVGAFLSGGIDSTAVVAFMRRHVAAENLHTVGVGFELPGLDETPYIELAASKYGTRHHQIAFRQSEIEPLLDRIDEIYDEPVADHSSLPTWALCEETRRWMTVALSGDGGDEAFGGYSSRQVVVQFALLRRVPTVLRQIAHRILAATCGYGWSRLGRIAEALRVSLLAPEDYPGEIGASLVYRPVVYRQWTRDCMRELLPLSRGDLVEAMLKFDIYFNRLGDNYAAKVDRMSMAHALEVRSPLMDYRLMEFASRVPVRWKISRRGTKIIFKKLLRGVVPDEILDRPKHGFAAPLSSWANEHTDELRRSADRLHTSGVLSDQWQEFFSSVFDGPRTPYASEYLKRLVFLDRWHRRWIEGA